MLIQDSNCNHWCKFAATEISSCHSVRPGNIMSKFRSGQWSLLLLIAFFAASSTSSIVKPASTLKRAATASKTTAPCVCVPYYHCNQENIVITNGEGSLDVRQSRLDPQDRPDDEMDSTCDEYIEVCCRLPEPLTSSCGLRRIPKVHVVRLDKEEAEEGEFPWMVTIFRKSSETRNNMTTVQKVYLCQGTLIHQKVVLTSAQCIEGAGNNLEPLFIRAGQTDTMLSDDESFHQERDVKQVIRHRKYNPIRLNNNVALLILKNPVTINRHVDITCLADRQDDIDQNKCVVSGWDKYLSPEDSQLQRSQVNVLKRREEPLISTSDCTTLLRNTPLGKRFRLDNSSVCAGGSPGKNFCSREIGGPLSCPLKSDPLRYVQVGIASWCISSGNLQTPSIFASVPRLRGWIDNQMTKANIDSSVYRATKE